jgi:hypothetical protein
MQRAKAAPSAPLMNHLRGGGERPRIGSGARRGLRHREARTRLTGCQRPQIPRLLLRCGHHLKQVHIALVRRRTVEGERPEQRVPRRLENHGLPAQILSEPAPLLADVRGEHSRRLGGLLQPTPQRLRPGVDVPVARLLFRQHHALYELGGSPGNVGDPLVDLEPNGHGDP